MAFDMVFAVFAHESSTGGVHLEVAFGRRGLQINVDKGDSRYRIQTKQQSSLETAQAAMATRSGGDQVTGLGSCEVTESLGTC